MSTSVASNDSHAAVAANSSTQVESYRSLHSGAVVGLVASLVSLFFPLLVVSADSLTAALPLIGLPIVSLAVSLWAIASIRGNQEYFTGIKPATVGALLSAITMLGGLGYGGYVYATEVPPGYARTSFLDMKPSDEDLRSKSPIPPEVQELKGSKVFIKGYIRPDSTKSRVNIKEFLLVRDNQECCFGDASKVMFFDQVKVDLTNTLTTDYELRVYRVGGTLSWRPGYKKGEPPIVYSIKADYIK